MGGLKGQICPLVAFVLVDVMAVFLVLDPAIGWNILLKPLYSKDYTASWFLMARIPLSKIVALSVGGISLSDIVRLCNFKEKNTRFWKTKIFVLFAPVLNI